MPDLVSRGGVRAVGISRRFVDRQPLHYRHIGGTIGGAVLNAYGRYPAGVVFLGDSFPQRHHQIRSIKAAVALDIRKRPFGIKHLIEHVFLKQGRINLQGFNGHHIGLKGDLAVDHCLGGNLGHQIGDRLWGFHAGFVIKKNVHRCRTGRKSGVVNGLFREVFEHGALHSLDAKIEVNGALTFIQAREPRSPRISGPRQIRIGVVPNNLPRLLHQSVEPAAIAQGALQLAIRRHHHGQPCTRFVQPPDHSIALV